MVWWYVTRTSSEVCMQKNTPKLMKSLSVVVMSLTTKGFLCVPIHFEATFSFVLVFVTKDTNDTEQHRTIPN